VPPPIKAPRREPVRTAGRWAIPPLIPRERSPPKRPIRSPHRKPRQLKTAPPKTTPCWLNHNLRYPDQPPAPIEYDSGMSNISLQELAHNPAAALDRVEAGEHIVCWFTVNWNRAGWA